MKRFLLLLLLPLAAYGQDLQTGVTFSDGDTVNAAALNNSINNATILPTFLSNKGAGTPAGTDSLLFYQTGTTSLKKVSLSSFFNLGLGFTTRTANTFLAGPGTSGASAAAPTWRVISPHDTAAVATDQTSGFSGLTINAASARTFYRILTANTTYTITNMLDGQTITVLVQQAATGGPWNCVFDTVKFNRTVTHTTTASSLDLYTIIKIGSVMYGQASQNHNVTQ